MKYDGLQSLRDLHQEAIVVACFAGKSSISFVLYDCAYIKEQSQQTDSINC